MIVLESYVVPPSDNAQEKPLPCDTFSRLLYYIPVYVRINLAKADNEEKIKLLMLKLRAYGRLAVPL